MFVSYGCKRFGRGVRGSGVRSYVATAKRPTSTKIRFPIQASTDTAVARKEGRENGEADAEDRDTTRKRQIWPLQLTAS